MKRLVGLIGILGLITFGPHVSAQTNWLVGGNSLGSTGIFGTTSNQGISFRTNNQVRMTLSNGGFWGLNTTALHARANIAHGWGHWLSFQTLNANKYWLFHNPPDDNGFIMYRQDGAVSKEIYQIRNNGDFRLGDGYSSIPVNSKFSVRQEVGDWIQLHRTADNGFWRFSNPSGQNRMAVFFTNSSGVNQPALSFWNDGKVSIGTESIPGNYKLYVKDGILTEKIKIALVGTGQWADYVFDPHYKLRSLDEVKAFINSNGHLPDVPSATEMVENGLDVLGMTATLLGKIEELTLYVIELKEELSRVQTLCNENGVEGKND